MIIYAISINSGGGKVLLDELLTHNTFGKPSILFLDERYLLPPDVKENDFQIIRVSPTLIERWKAEIKLRNVVNKQKNNEEFVLCFSNLPPVFKLKLKTIVYLQNAFLLLNVKVPRDNIKAFLRSTYERIWFYLFIKNANEIWVQTHWMRDSILSFLKAKTYLRPFLPTFPTLGQTTKDIDFITVTGPDKHKNLRSFLYGVLHSNLINSRFSVITNGISEELLQIVSDIKARGINIEIHLCAKREETLSLISRSKFLVITSTLESFCLPLHEAMHYQTKIISGNFSFINEYSRPAFEIDPNSPESISKALQDAVRVI